MYLCEFKLDSLYFTKLSKAFVSKLLFIVYDDRHWEFLYTMMSVQRKLQIAYEMTLPSGLASTHLLK